MKVTISTIVYILFLLHLTPNCFKNMVGAFSYFYLVIKGVAGFAAIMLFIKEKQKSTVLTNLSIYLIFIGAMTFLRAFTSDNLIRYFAVYGDIFIIAVLTEYLIRNNAKKFIIISNSVFWAGLLLNVATVFLLPNGLVQSANESGQFFPNFFYDYDNRFILRYIPTILIIYLYEKYYKANHKKQVMVLISILLCLLSLVYTGSAACSIAFLLILFGFIVKKYIPFCFVSFKKIWLVYALITLLIIGVAIVSFGGYLSLPMLDFIGKSESLLKRIRMWSKALVVIPNTLFLGTGILNTTIMRQNFDYAQLHNSLFNIVLFSGLVGLFLYLRFVFSITKENIDNIDDYKFFALLFCAIMLSTLVDGLEMEYPIYLFYIILGNYQKVKSALVKNNLGHDKLVSVIKQS